MIDIEIGKTYRNKRGELRKIVAPYYDGSQYVFIDHLNWTYTKEGIYDEPDFYCRDGGGDDWQLIEEVGTIDHAANLCLWVEAALSCNSWHWDAQQFDCALMTVNDYRVSSGLPVFVPERF